MPTPLESLILQLLDWLGDGRPYDETLAAWRTNCPRMPVWEEVTARALIARTDDPARGPMVRPTASGRRFQEMNRADPP